MAESGEEYAPEFECQSCGKRVSDDGADSLLGWFHDEDGELSFCAECGPELGPPSQGVLDRFHTLRTRAHSEAVLRNMTDHYRAHPPTSPDADRIAATQEPS